MVGGTVIEVVTLKEKVYINCIDHPAGRQIGDQCAIYVERNSTSERVEIGDAIWWQGRVAYWTPCANRSGRPKGLRCGIDYDIPIPRMGYSGVSHPFREVLE